MYHKSIKNVSTNSMLKNGRPKAAPRPDAETRLVSVDEGGGRGGEIPALDRERGIESRGSAKPPQPRGLGRLTNFNILELKLILRCSKWLDLFAIVT